MSKYDEQLFNTKQAQPWHFHVWKSWLLSLQKCYLGDKLVGFFPKNKFDLRGRLLVKVRFKYTDSTENIYTR